MGERKNPRVKILRSRRILVVAGQRFGKLTIIREVRRTATGKRMFLLKCDCGKTTTAKLEKLRHHKRSSCGCAWKKHGLRAHPLYRTWESMIRRCSDPRRKGWPRYGGRGIRVCEEWQQIEIFIQWCEANGWQRGLQIDRINNDGNYEPSNCRIVTALVNQRNKKSPLDAAFLLSLPG